MMKLCKHCRTSAANTWYEWCDDCIRASPLLQSICVTIDAADASCPPTLWQRIFGRKPRYENERS
jgi:hypothetical protein